MAHSAREPYVAIKQDIITCRLKPGDIVNESELASAYGVSRTVVREALQLLGHDGLMEAVPRVGHVVRTVTVRDLIDLYGAREVVEPAITALAAENAHAEEIDCITEMAEAESGLGQEIGAVMRRNSEFHLAVAAASHNQILASIEFSLMERLERLFNLQLLGDASQFPARTLVQHRALASAIARRDARAAREVALAQIQTSRERLLRDMLSGEAGRGISVGGWGP